MTQTATIESIIGEVQDLFEQVSVDRSISFQRESEFAIQALYANEFARGIALKNPQSVRNAVVNLAAIGISLNPARRQAYLVPRSGAIALDVSYIGMLDMAIATGSIAWGQAELVYETDQFKLNGIDKQPTHLRDPFSADRGNLRGVYCVVKTRDGDYLTTTMSAAEVDAIRSRSESGKRGGGPWKTDYNAMALKSVVRKGSKFWPRSERLDKAVEHMDLSGEGIDFAAEAAAASAAHTGFDLDAALQAVALGQNRADLDALFSKHGKLAMDVKDRIGYKRLAEACRARAAQIETAASVAPQGEENV